MKYRDLSLSVGKSAIDDKRQLSIPGRLVTPDTKSNTLLLISAGFTGKHPDYFEYFGKLLGEEFNVYITEQRRRGLANGSTMTEDLLQIDRQAREITEADNVVYVGHSMGTAVANRAVEDNGQDVKGLYGICAYPTFGDTRANSADLDKRSLSQRIVDLAARSGFGPLATFTNGNEATIPMKIAIGGNDHLLRTYKPAVQERLIKKFSQHGAQTEVFDGMNHCFNYKAFDLSPFNRDSPQVLVDSVKEFVYETA